MAPNRTIGNYRRLSSRPRVGNTRRVENRRADTRAARVRNHSYHVDTRPTIHYRIPCVPVTCSGKDTRLGPGVSVTHVRRVYYPETVRTVVVSDGSVMSTGREQSF